MQVLLLLLKTLSNRSTVPELGQAVMNGYPPHSALPYPTSASSSYAASPHESRHPTPGLSSRSANGVQHLDNDLFSAGPSSAQLDQLPTPSSAGGQLGGLQAAVVASAADGDDEEPLYVNAKQYNRILKRRLARARLEELHRLSRQRKVCCYHCQRRVH